jgi:hypothetical protein
VGLNASPRVIGTTRRPAIKVERAWRQGSDLTV